MNLSMADLVTGRFKDVSEELIDGIQYIDELPDDTTPSNLYVLVQREDTEIGAYFAIPIAGKDKELPEDITGLAALDNTPILLLRLKIKHDEKLFADVISGETLIEGYEAAGITAVAVVETSQVLGVKDATIEWLKAAGHVDANGDRVGGALSGKAASSRSGTKKGGGKRGREVGAGGDRDEDEEQGEGEGEGDGELVVKDAMGVVRVCSSRAKTHARVRDMAFLFRACTDIFRQRFCGDLLIDTKEIHRTIHAYAVDSSVLRPGHAEYGMRKALRVKTLSVVTGGFAEGSAMATALRGQFDAYDYSCLSILSFLPEKESTADMWVKGKRSEGARAVLAAGARNHDSWLQVLSCEDFEGASAVLAGSLTQDADVWAKIDNVMILANLSRMFASFYSELRLGEFSTTFPTPRVLSVLSCGRGTRRDLWRGQRV
jgi:hypothetical protein